ncbi:SpoIVD-associated factor A [Dissostichus eleginoides]|uniref:SpoIVD-associated factor A n=1 Tax=Dissostichus eleginoides TaxID=100907 RepID=A0AAD9B657_DISEL|nr:SpoIVD-associated factor A [Dissostichus eleginoides]
MRELNKPDYSYLKDKPEEVCATVKEERVVENTEHMRTYEEEWTGEEHLPVDPVPAECEQEDLMWQEERPVVPQTTSGHPSDDQASQPQARKSTRERKTTQRFTYDSLGQPYQPQTVCNTVGAYGSPSMPFWEMNTHPMTYHTPFRTLPYTTSYQTIPYTPAMQYTTPLFVY